MQNPKPRQGRPLSDKIDRGAPASIVIGKFGGLTPFCQLSGYPVSTVHDWTAKGLIPSSEFAKILRLAKEFDFPVDRADFVPAEVE